MDKIVVSIPAYNEGRTIALVVNEIRQVMEKHNYSYQILVVDDGSKDNTAEAAKKAGAVVFSHQTNMGLAEAFRTEISKCLQLKADIIVHIDADRQYLPTEIPKLVSELKKGYDLVLGSRFAGKIESMPIVKRWGNRMFSRVISNITKTKITDGQTGFRAFTAKFAEEVQIKSSHTYTQEQIIRAVKGKYRVKEVPIYFAKRRDGQSRLMKSPFRYAVRAWINILRVYRDYEPLKFFGSVGMIMISLSALIFFVILYFFISRGRAVLDNMIPTIILGIFLFLSGLQILLFGFLADKE
jgi:glycosyltransferase involved in cell wall biosynthesis